MAIPQLCDALLALIQEFTNVRALCSTCSQLVPFRSRLLRWSFTYFHSYKYCTSMDFRERAGLVIHDLYRQLDLPIPIWDPFYRFPPLSSAHIVDLTNNHAIHNMHLPLFANVHTLILAKCKAITDVSSLHNVRTLDLSDCFHITDISALQNVEEINLSYCYGIVDVSALRNARKVILRCCYGITNVDCLQNVDTLDISTCINVEDVSKLSHVKRLIMRNCPSIPDVSGLQQVQELDIRDSNVVGIEKLLNLKTLYKDNLIVSK
jgi:hypothetical protein